jgi:predicted phosphodiesterase
MRLLLLGDTHFEERGPDRRKDDYFLTQLCKLKQIFSIYGEEKCDAILQVGDFFNSPYVSNYVKSNLITDLKHWGNIMYCIFGQHDIFGHAWQTFERSPLAVLEAAAVLKVVRDPCTRIEGKSGDCVYVYGACFGCEVPKVESEHTFNILLVHDMIGDRELYPGQELKGPRDYLRKYPNYDLIVCGDYHYTFKDSHQGRIICNPGCLMRKTIGEFDLQHKPGVFIFDTDSKDLKWILLDVEPVEDVFDFTKTESIKEDSSKVVEFIEKLRANNEDRAAWREALRVVLEEKKVCSRVRTLLDSVIAYTLENK